MRFRTLCAVAILAAATPAFGQAQTATKPGTIAPNAVTVQGCHGAATGCIPVDLTGTISSSGTADAVSGGAPTTFNGNSVCTGQLLLAGEQGAGFQLNSGGTLVGTLTPQYSLEASGSNWTTTQFIDQNGTKTASISATNPTTLSQLGIVLVTGSRRAQVCTTAYTSGSATGFAVAAFVQGGQAASGGGGSSDVTIHDPSTPANKLAVNGSGQAAIQNPPNLDAALSTRATETTAQAIRDRLPAALDASGGVKVHEVGTAAISAASLPLPSGAATEATLGNVAKDATLTGGTAKAIARGGAKGATSAADLTSTAEGVDHQALDVTLWLAGSALDPRTRTWTLASGTDSVSAVQGTAAGAGSPWSIELSDGAAFYTAAKTGQFPSALVSGRLDVNVGATVNPSNLDVALSTRAADSKFTDDAGVSSAASETAGTRLATTAGLRLLDTGQGAGSQLVAWKGDGTSGAWVNIKSSVSLGRTWNLGASDVPDLSDRAARLVGVIYGSQAQQLKQSATNFNTVVELAVGSGLIDPRSIRALTSGDTVTAVQATGTNLHIVCDSGCGGAASFGDLAAFTAGTTAINVAGGVFNDGLSAVASGQAAAPRITAQRAEHVNLRNNSGTEIGTQTTPLVEAQSNTGTAGSTLLSAVTVAGNGSTYTNTNGNTSHAVHITTTGSPTAVVLNLQGSFDNSNWITLASTPATPTTPMDLFAMGWYPYIRANLATLTGGTSPTVTAVYHGANVSSQVADLVSDSTAVGTLSTTCSDVNINACTSGSVLMIATAGQAGVGAHVTATGATLVGDIKADCSYDNGVTWKNTFFDDPAGNKLAKITLASGQGFDATIVGCGGQGHARVRNVTATGSSAASGTSLRASMVADPTALYGGANGSTTQPPVTAQVGGWDNGTTSLQPVNVTAKGTQGTKGVATQDIKDAGRTRVIFTADAVAVATTEGLVTFTKNVGGTATTAQTTYSVTAAKTFRVQAIVVSLSDTGTTVARTRVRLRENTGGACIASSAIAFTGDFGPFPGTQAAGLGMNGPFVVPIPDGLEFPASDSICLSEVATTNTTAVLSITLIGYEY